MAKISELGPDELKKYIAKYEKKVRAGGENVVADKRTLSKLKLALSKFEDNDDENKEPQEVMSYHSSEVDYTSYEDASIRARAIATSIDGVLLTIASNIVMFGVEKVIVGSIPAEAKLVLLGINLLLGLTLPTLYAIYFLRKSGQTIGKKLMKVKVIYEFEDSNEQLGIWTIIVRELIGKIISSMFLMLGYIVRVFGYRTWHDKFAKTRVISVK